MWATIRFAEGLLRSLGLGLAMGLVLGAASPAWAQAEPDGAAEPSLGAPEGELEPVAGGRLSRDEARRLLEQPLPAESDARYALLQQQYRAALRLDDRVRLIEAARQLVEVGRGRPGGEAWIRFYLAAEFAWGSSGKALEAAEPFIGDSSLSLVTRATAALRQTYFAAQGGDRAIVARLWSRADGLARRALEQAGSGPAQLRLDHLQVRAETQRLAGDPAAAVASLRESIGVGRRHIEALRAAGRGPGDTALNEARGMLDGSFGILIYALVQNGRPQEALEIARANVAQWRAGQWGDSVGARWLYRSAAGLVATQQYEAALAAARESEQVLERVGAGTASHTRWHARLELLRALIGLRRWQEADASYGEFLAAMPPDALARTRASDNRLLTLLAAKNGRFEQAIDIAERLHRYRMRLFGPNHPQTQEAAGLRAVVRLLRGEISAAMADYEVLFAATLDTPAGWLDLDARGVRGYVLGIAFDEFMHFVATRALKGEQLDRDITDRAFQVADRLGLGVTQRAITDSTARVLAATPALRALLEAEQVQRQAVSAAFTQLNSALGDEDALRRETQTEAFKARPDPERRAHAARLRQQRELVKKLQADAAAARTALEEQRQKVAREFPDYAELVTPTIASPRALRRLLAPHEAMLVVQPQAQATLVWLLPPEGPVSFAASPLTREALALRVASLREMLDIGAAPAGKRPALQAAALHALWRDLFAGVEPALRDVKSLIVATNGALAALPLAALVTEAPAPGVPTAWLVRRMSVSQLPAPASLHALRRVAQPPLAVRALIGFGDPVFDLKAVPAPVAAGVAAPVAVPVAAAATAPLPGGRRIRSAAEAGRYDAETGFRYADIPPLPETRQELLAVAEALGASPTADLVLGDRATRRAVLAAPLADRRVVAFATHGLMPGELPGVSKPALAMAAEPDPKESALLELDDVLGLRLNAQWVLLSACNTAAGEQEGAAMSGLVRGFFFAGARSVLATHWAVETESAAALSTSTFRQLRQGERQGERSGEASRAEALRRAQLTLIDGTQGGGRWAHPYFWAPYALFGDPAR
ncbi:MAG: CHAT domain-containing protein [Burkholderiales bacterium]|nr:CHAT domain-containing protein [Burkholderiales bacterium]